nr:MAG: ORF1 [Torque teno midi virus]
MAFWWNRRRRWYKPRNYRYRKRRYTRRPRKTIFRRRRRRAPRRRRRRRKTKVRKKKKFIKLLQWQPDSIRKCKIKGYETVVLGANGKQFRSYTTAMNEWTPATVPTGGGFGTARYNLAYLYEQYKLGNNIWTHSNKNFDLCRYTGCRLKIFRHPTQDFVCTYQREYPMVINEDTYSQTHPHSQLLQKRKIVVPSLKYQPYGKPYIIKKIKPPKQQVNKWFFQHSFTDTGLLFFKAAACDLHYIHLGEYSENELTSFLALNTQDFFTHAGWGKTSSQAYQPVVTWNINAVSGTDQQGKPFTVNIGTTYDTSIAYDTGWFNTKILTAKTYTTHQLVGKTPLIGVRYNPKTDTGEGNAIWLVAIQADKFDKPHTDKTLIASGKPMWLLLYGWSDYVKRLKKDEPIYKYYFLVLQSKCFITSKTTTTPTYIVPIDDSFINGRSPYDTTVTTIEKKHWYPTLYHQQKTMNNIVMCGPFIPRPEGKKSNWELNINYCFFFKWGGAMQPPNEVSDPATATEYPVPDKLSKGIQISDPKTQIPASLLHTWDFRRGLITPKAFKRMSDHLPIETTISTDSEYHSPHKKHKPSKKEAPLQEKETETQICLQQLFEEDTCQEIQEETTDPILQLIHQQHKQQQLIKHNLLSLLTSLKQTQLQMQIQTGILE